MKLNYFKKALCLTIFGAATWTAQGQQLSGDIAQQTVSTAASSNTAVKLIDNKGTIKYLQVSNGITSLTNSTNNKTTTTWQLGGSLTSDTYIDVNGQAFALDGLELINSATTGASTDTTDQSDHGTGTGWTLLIRDEATGKIQKMKATDIVQSGQASHTATTLNENDGTAVINAVGIPLNLSKVWVYRNGAKLSSADFALTTDTVTVNEVPNSWELYENDAFEVQWIK